MKAELKNNLISVITSLILCVGYFLIGFYFFPSDLQGEFLVYSSAIFALFFIIRLYNFFKYLLIESDILPDWMYDEVDED